ncbi:MAG: hypothetical protein ACI8VR_000999, partial [Candidatus Azotimanducaceae bacterium]
MQSITCLSPAQKYRKLFGHLFYGWVAEWSCRAAQARTAVMQSITCLSPAQKYRKLFGHLF